MASWKDGAAYAPTERPDGFATPRAEPLSGGEPWRAPTPGPIAAPDGFDAAAQPPLAQLATGGKQGRDPRESFAVTGSALTPGPVAGAKRDPRAPILTSAPQPVGREWVSEAGSQLPAPTGRPLPPPPGELLGSAPTPVTPAPAPVTGPPPSVGGPPQGLPPARRAQAPGTPPSQWPQPPGLPQWPQPPGLPERPPAQQRQLVLIAGGLCFLGLILTPLSPFVLTAAGALGMRTEALTGRAGRSALAIGLALLGWQLITDTLGRDSAVGMIASLVFTIVFVAGGLRSR
ncbi:hypothetical protein [Tessaracoccus sp. G1721]